MPERDHYIPGVPCWVDAGHPEPEATLDFYRGLFGWEFESVLPPDSPGKYFMARVRGGDVAAVGSIPAGAPPVAMWNTYVAVAERRRHGGDGPRGRRDRRDGALRRHGLRAHGRLHRPRGRGVLRLAGRAHFGARVVNEHGAVNFNGLHTRDVEAAKAFYGAVFGWTTLAIGAGEMWTLPGYGDDLERANPGLREMIAQTGGPAGFEDVVASINPIAADRADTQPHWSVTFGVDDADAAAAKATELGGTAIVEPFDAPWSRLTILGDPQGASFVASQFVPENKELGDEAAA